MKKIVLVFDGTNFSEGAFEFVKKMNEKSPVLVTGVFLPQAQLANLWSYANSASAPLFVPLLESDEAEEIAENIAKFENTCKKNGIEYRTHKDFFDFGLSDLKKETRFADLIVIGSERFYEGGGIKEPNEYLKNLLHDAECPVVVVPENFLFPENNILAYDGSDSSVFAIKQFAYLFPDFEKNPTLLVYAREEDNKKIPEELYIEELAARHFPDLTIMKLELDPKKYFATWISEKKNSILVSGSFGRPLLSVAFKKSFISQVIKEHKLPVFITHR